MARKELRPYHENGKGLVELGSFHVLGKWDETGVKEFHQSVTADGSRWIEGNKKKAEFRIRFGKISPEQANALMLALAGWRGNKTIPIPVTLGATRFDILYLHNLLVEPHEPTPVGLLFSNELP
jgi:hypothetical protein